MRIKNTIVEEQVQWVLLYMQEESANVLKKNIIENLERELLNYKLLEEFLADLKEEFEERDDKIMKVAELKNVEQECKTMEEFVCHSIHKYTFCSNT